MNFHSFRSSLVAGVLALAASFLLASCGGGGASGNPNQGGAVAISPPNGTLYAGIPYTFTVSGGRRPYAISSSDQTALPVPNIVDGNTFEVIPNNPGVINPGLQAGDLPRKTVTVTARDTTGILVATNVDVGQNFLTGYTISLAPTNCPLGTGTTPPSACAGGETAVQFAANFNGTLHGNELYRLEVIRGPFTIRNPINNQVGQSVQFNSDHNGIVTGLLEVSSSATTQIAVIRIVHVPTGVYTDHVFMIQGASTSTTPLTIIPNTFTFTGNTTTECGTGVGDFFVFDGQPPYAAVSANPSIQVVEIDANAQPGHFRLAAGNASVCVPDGVIIVTDSRGSRGTVSVVTERGSNAAPAPPPLTAAPTTVTLTCGTAGSVSVVGGTPPYTANSANPSVTATVSGNTVTVSRAANDAGGGPFPTATPVTITDGTSLVTVTVNAPATCP